MRRIRKIFLTSALAASVCAVFIGGCAADGRDGLDGKDGKDVSIYEIYEAVKAETDNPDLTFAEFIKDYLSYDGVELEQALSLTATVNRSLLSAVSVVTTFDALGTAKGSGVIVGIGEDGAVYAVTNCHVVYYADSVYNPRSGSYRTTEYYGDSVLLYAYGLEYSDFAMNASIVATCKNYDLALLKIEAEDVKVDDLLVAEWNTEEQSAVGSAVYTIGNAEGEGLSATFGYISVDSEWISIDLENTTYDFSDDYTYRVMRTDLAINEGNSGGALFDKDGRIVGIVNAKTTSADGMGYALPASTSRRVIDNMLANAAGETQYGILQASLGITTSIYRVSREFNSDTGLTELNEVVQVASVDGGGKADGKLEEGDIVLAIKVVSSDGATERENLTVTREYNLTDAMLSVQAGDTVCLTVKRNGESEEQKYNFTFSSGEFSLYV